MVVGHNLDLYFVIIYLYCALGALGERQREIHRETNGTDVTYVALKLAMSFALFLAKNCTLVSPLLNGA